MHGRPIPDYGDVFTLDEFVRSCKSHSIIDYDGSGEYAIDGKMTGVAAVPSCIVAGEVETQFTHVVWFSK
jgi:hypothetical protein